MVKLRKLLTGFVSTALSLYRVDTSARETP
jgi:hypothetical protein